MKKFKISKWLLALALGVTATTGLQSPVATKAAYPGEWVQDENGWMYEEHSSRGEKWQVYEGIRNIGGKQYCFKDGYMVTGGWTKVYGYDVYAGADGALLTGWQDIDGKMYYFYSTGRLATDTTIDGKYYVDENGVYVGENQWKSDSRGWYYVYANPKRYSVYHSGTGETIYFNYPQNMIESIDGALYGFDQDGYMRTGWVSHKYYVMEEDSSYTECTEWYYADTNGKLVRGWKQIDGTWYYFDNWGGMVFNQVVDGYQLGEDGALVGTVAGWMKDDRGWWYQADTLTNISTGEIVSGYPRGGMYKIDGEFYYFDADGYMITGWVDMNKLYDPSYTGTPEWYYFNEDGMPVKDYSWKQIDGVWYYFLWNGKMADFGVWDGYEFDENGGYKKVETETIWSWKTDGTKWWYENTDGEYRANEICDIDEKYYAFDGNGYMMTCWVDYSEFNTEFSKSVWYYFEADGSGADGWKQIDGAWYYFSDGYMCYDTVIDGCYVNSDGVWVDPDPGYAIGWSE